MTLLPAEMHTYKAFISCNRPPSHLPSCPPHPHTHPPTHTHTLPPHARQILSDDYSKAAFLLADRNVALHSRMGTHYKMRIPKHGRDLAYCPASAELLLAASAPEIYRMSLYEGRFMTPLLTRSPAVNAVGISPAHGLFAAAGEDGGLECFDPRQRQVNNPTPNSSPNLTSTPTQTQTLTRTLTLPIPLTPTPTLTLTLTQTRNLILTLTPTLTLTLTLTLTVWLGGSGGGKWDAWG
jgi:hypothetical protein